jgi:DNA invertase Pin-like site-specific DNA recombinase
MTAASAPLCYIYSRVSHLDAVKGVSLDKQIHDGWGYYESHLADQGVLRGEPIKERAVSAFTVPFMERPEGGRLCHLLRPGDHLVIIRFDRAFRSVEDFARTWRILESRGIMVHILNPQIDMTTANGRFMAQIYCAVAQMESDMKSERLREAFYYQRQHNYPRVVPSRTGRAFDFPGVVAKRTKAGQQYLEPEEKSFATFQFMLQLMLPGNLSWDELRERCEEHYCRQLGVEYMRSAFHKQRWGHTSNMKKWFQRRAEFVPVYEGFGLSLPEALMPMPSCYQFHDDLRRKTLEQMEGRLPGHLRTKKVV